MVRLELPLEFLVLAQPCQMLRFRNNGRHALALCTEVRGNKATWAHFQLPQFCYPNGDTDLEELHIQVSKSATVLLQCDGGAARRNASAHRDLGSG